MTEDELDQLKEAILQYEDGLIAAEELVDMVQAWLSKQRGDT